MYLARPLFNETRGHAFDGYKIGSALVASRHVVQAQGETVDEAAEFAFRWFNSDDRDNGREERSLSVGDVVQIMDTSDGSMHFRSVEGVGFQPVLRLSVVKSLRQRGDGSATADQRPRGLGLYAAMKLADTFVTPETAVDTADEYARQRLGIAVTV